MLTEPTLNQAGVLNRLSFDTPNHMHVLRRAVQRGVPRAVLWQLPSKPAVCKHKISFTGSAKWVFKAD